MGLIYKITNKINNCIYIGKTIRSLEVRIAEHKRDSLRQNIVENQKIFCSLRNEEVI